MKKDDMVLLKRLERVMNGKQCNECPVRMAAAAGLTAAGEAFACWAKRSGRRR